MAESEKSPLVGIITGSKSDLKLKAFKKGIEVYEELDITFETSIRSAHRTPDRLFEYASTASARGIEVIIATAGGSAHIAGMAAAKTELPVLAVPRKTRNWNGIDSLLSMIEMPPGVTNAVFGIDGYENAALFAAQILSKKYPEIKQSLLERRQRLGNDVIIDDENLQKLGLKKFLKEYMRRQNPYR